jgi:hypothetical protein
MKNKGKNIEKTSQYKGVSYLILERKDYIDIKFLSGVSRHFYKLNLITKERVKISEENVREVEKKIKQEPAKGESVKQEPAKGESAKEESDRKKEKKSDKSPEKKLKKKQKKKPEKKSKKKAEKKPKEKLDKPAKEKPREEPEKEFYYDKWKSFSEKEVEDERIKQILLLIIKAYRDDVEISDKHRSKILGHCQEAIDVDKKAVTFILDYLNNKILPATPYVTKDVSVYRDTDWKI